MRNTCIEYEGTPIETGTKTKVSTVWKSFGDEIAIRTELKASKKTVVVEVVVVEVVVYGEIVDVRFSRVACE